MEENKNIEEKNTKKPLKEEKEHKNKKVKVLEEEIENLKQENASLKEEVLRSKADLINYRKRKDDETAQMIKFANANLLTSILPIVDDFERALAVKEENMTKEVKNFLLGVKMIYNKFVETLNTNGVKEIDCLHKEFDSKLANCLYTEDNKDYPYDTVLEVFTKGYTYYDKVLRCASVKVNKQVTETVSEDKNENKEDASQNTDE